MSFSLFISNFLLQSRNSKLRNCGMLQFEFFFRLENFSVVASFVFVRRCRHFCGHTDGKEEKKEKDKKNRKRKRCIKRAMVHACQLYRPAAATNPLAPPSLWSSFFFSVKSSAIAFIFGPTKRMTSVFFPLLGSLSLSALFYYQLK